MMGLVATLLLLLATASGGLVHPSGGPRVRARCAPAAAPRRGGSGRVGFWASWVRVRPVGPLTVTV